MPVTYTLSGIFDNAKVKQAASNAISKTLVEFAAYVKKEQVESTPTGRLYRRKSGSNFRRSHRASAKGQRPAIDSGKLLNSTKKNKVSELKGEVTTIAKRDGFDYASQLEKMGRHIQDDPKDIKKGEELLRKNVEAQLAKLK